MSLEYILLTVIALIGSFAWINSVRQNGSKPLEPETALKAMP
ncbi:hypothetical protein SESI111939_15655 [Serratia silvae]